MCATTPAASSWAGSGRRAEKIVALLTGAGTPRLRWESQGRRMGAESQFFFRVAESGQEPMRAVRPTRPQEPQGFPQLMCRASPPRMEVSPVGGVRPTEVREEHLEPRRALIRRLRSFACSARRGRFLRLAAPQSHCDSPAPRYCVPPHGPFRPQGRSARSSRPHQPAQGVSLSTKRSSESSVTSKIA